MNQVLQNIMVTHPCQNDAILQSLNQQTQMQPIKPFNKAAELQAIGAFDLEESC